MTETSISIMTGTVVQLAQLAVVAYGIGAARSFAEHWLDKPPGPLLERRTAEERRIDAARVTGDEPYAYRRSDAQADKT